MLCYRCGTHAPDTAQACPNCGQKLTGSGLRQATGTFSRRRATAGTLEGAPFKAQELIASRYLIKEVVGGGPLGFVFRAQDKEIDVEVALKVINPKLVQTPDERKQFAKQLRLARKLSHPNLVRVYEEGEDQDRPYFTSQFLDGLTLRKIIELRLQKGQFFTLVEIEPILSQICGALDGAHKVGPHSDVKPENVLVLPDLLKVTDFGLGLAMPRLPFVQAMKARKLDRYLAPELVDGGEIDLRADLYSVGVIIGEMLSGQTPDGAIPELGKKNETIPAAVEGFYRKCINANPLARFKSAGELMGEFSDLVRKHGGAVGAAPTEVPPLGAPGVARPRNPTGMLQLQPRRPGPPVPAPGPTSVGGIAPPPPPPVTGETALPDATQPVDSVNLRSALEAPMSAQDAKDNREPTAVIDSGQLLAVNTDDEETKVGVETTPGLAATAQPLPPTAPPQSALRPVPASSSSTWIYVAVLVILGVGLGAGGGYYWIQKQRGGQSNQVSEAERAAIEREVADRLARAEKEAAEKLAAEKAVADKAAAEKAAAEKAAAEKAAAEKAAAEKDAADKLAAEKLAAEKLAAEKGTPPKPPDPTAAKPPDKAPEKTPAVAPPTPAPAAAAGGCPEGMKPVAAGAFRMGTAKDDPMAGFEDKALTSVTVAAFCVDTFEYPNKRGVAPTVSVTFADAERMCTSAGKRLCSEAEWEKACKGAGSAKWGYSNTFDADACNTEDDTGEARSLASSGRFGRCRSSYGAQDMSGNVAEWTSERVVKGGSYATSDYGVRCAARKTSGVTKSSEVGFRCCADLR